AVVGVGDIDVAIDSGGNVYIANTNNGSVEVFQVTCTTASLAGANPARTDARTSAKGDLRTDGPRGRLGPPIRAPWTPLIVDNPYELAQAISAGEYRKDFDLNADGRLDRTDMAIAVEDFGVGTVEDFLTGDGSVASHPALDPPHILDRPNRCGRCHSMQGAPDGGMLAAAGQMNLCLSCHSAGKIAGEDWIGGGHLANSHPWGIPASSADVPGPPPDSEHALHLDNGNIRCGTCHEPHESIDRPAYIRTPIWGQDNSINLCGVCHEEFDEWQHAGHAEEDSFAFTYPIGPTHTACAQCHSGDGYIDFTEGVPEAERRTNHRVIDCLVCHAAHGKPQSDKLLRVFDDVTLPGDVTFTGKGASATCMSCHNGRRAPGEGAFPHYALGGVMLEGINAIDFGNTSLTNSAHTGLLSCVDCHMAPGPAPGEPGAGKVGGHTFNLKVHDPDDPDYGFENVANACQRCHAGLTTLNRRARGDYDGDGIVEGVQDETQGLLDLVFNEILAKGAVYLGHYPYWDFSGVVDDPPGTLQTVQDAVWNWEYVKNAGDLGIKNTAYAVGVLQLTYEKLTGHVLNAYLRYVPDGTTAKAEYVGTDTCLTCHGAMAVTGTDYSFFRNSGHPFKLNEVVDGQMPTYPFSSIAGALGLMTDDDSAPGDPKPGTDNTLGTPSSYFDISYVIGGYGWKARWIDAAGFIITGSAVQYNLETMAMSAYHDNDVDKPYTCGNCHTTGWKAYTSEPGDTRNLNRQKNLPGMAGTFYAGGIQCEACHGAGSFHAADPRPDNITRVATPRTTADFLADDMAYGKPVACSECHTRDGEMDYPTYVAAGNRIRAKGGLIRHHEQYDELVGINPDDVPAGPTGPHKNLACTACHDPHSTTIYQDVSGDPPGLRKSCTDCHNADGVGGKDYTLTGGMANLACTDCHMPYLVKSAVSHPGVGTGPVTGDIRTHIFRIDLSKTDQFTPDGAFAYPWITGQWACNTCHNGVDVFALTFPDTTITIHGGTQADASFPDSLHGTRQGKATFYSAANGGFETLTGIAMADLHCQSCHAATLADGTPVDPATYTPSCADCHIDPVNPTGEVDDSVCYGCHARQGAEGGVGLPDVHRDAGMKCVDCHTAGDMHGDGNAYASMLDHGAIDTKCEQCHPVETLGKHIGHSAHLATVDCSACHTQSVISCYNCHFESMVNDGIKKFFGPPPRSGFKLLVNRNGKVHTASFQSATYQGNSFYVIAPYTAHSIVREVACSSCHANAAIQEYDTTGQITVTTWDAGTGTLIGPSGVIPVPPDWSTALQFDFLNYDPGTDTWSYLETGADLTQMMYGQPLTPEQLDALSMPQGP
ncbi:MAG: hypothetical protein D6788_03535, partial [Planctomycetota bacterium]